MGTKIVSLKLNSKGPLLMHCDKFANPMDQGAIAMKALTAKLKKSQEVLTEIARLSYFGSLYNSDGVVGIPGVCLEAAIKDAAKLQKLGKVVEREVMVVEHFMPLTYDGPQDPNELWADKKFCDCRSVVVGKARVMRYRPKFSNWTLAAHLQFDDKQIDIDRLLGIVRDAGSKIGICDFRPKFGRFELDESTVSVSI